MSNNFHLNKRRIKEFQRVAEKSHKKNQVCHGIRLFTFIKPLTEVEYNCKKRALSLEQLLSCTEIKINLRFGNKIPVELVQDEYWTLRTPVDANILLHVKPCRSQLSHNHKQRLRNGTISRCFVTAIFTFAHCQDISQELLRCLVHTLKKCSITHNVYMSMLGELTNGSVSLRIFQKRCASLYQEGYFASPRTDIHTHLGQRHLVRDDDPPQEAKKAKLMGKTSKCDTCWVESLEEIALFECWRSNIPPHRGCTETTLMEHLNAAFESLLTH